MELFIFPIEEPLTIIVRPAGNNDIQYVESHCGTVLKFKFVRRGAVRCWHYHTLTVKDFVYRNLAPCPSSPGP